jgi:hypothetical protein
MNTDEIVEVAIDNSGRLIVKPRKQTFEFIYRSAMEVHWNDTKQCLYSPRPREWTYFDWYKQIIYSVESEYGYKLVLSDKTKWINVYDSLKEEIETWANTQLV